MGKPVAIGSDHAGIEMKSLLMDYLHSKGIEVHDCGAYSNESVDYPDYAKPVCDLVRHAEVDFGILICGTGNGMAMSANKFEEIRAALCWEAGIATFARSHNDANILVLPARFISGETAVKCLEAFMNTTFEGGRHVARIEKMSRITAE